MKKLFTVLFVAALFLNHRCNAQSSSNLIFIDTSYTVQQMVMDFFGTTSCVTVGNVSYTGGPNTAAFFDASNTNLGLNAGLVFCTGLVDSLGKHSSWFNSGCTGTPSDPTLDAFSGGTGTGYDAAVIEFDIVPNNDTMCFKYVFGSEEYNEYVGSSFNDVFGFFISGPGIIGLQNVALVPNTTLPVSVNNINCGTNSQYYVCNDANSATSGGCNAAMCPVSSDSTQLSYDGFTTPLCAKLVLQHDSTYHIKLAIEDKGDCAFDSGIFLSIESLCGGAALACHANFLPGFGANSNDVHFANHSTYGSHWFWNFGDGTTSTEKNPNHTYTQNGTYTVTLITCNFSGCDTTYQTVTVGTSGIHTPSLSNVTIYPNPAANVLHIQSVNGNEGMLKVYDAAGRLMASRLMKSSASLNVSEWSSGVYTVEMITDNNVSRTRFVKK